LRDFVATAAVVCALGAGCGGRGGGDTAPVASLASTRGAQEAFRPLKQRFVTSDRAGRAMLEPNLTWFVATFPNDGLTPLARLYLGLIAVDRGDAAGARQAAQGVAAGQSGTTRDLAELLDGAILLEQHATTQALERFMALVGKLIDPYARMLLDEHIVAAAIEARRWYEAVAYMDLWLRDAPEESGSAVRLQVQKSLESVPVEALELMLQAMRTDGERTGYGAEIKKALVGRLAAVALEKQDTGLARRLVDSTVTSQALGDAAEGLEELASSGGAATVDGRTIGLLVSAGQSHLGARAAEVLTGVVDALRVGGDSADHVRLASRDERDPKRTELALLALVSQGASILIAGLDPAQADVAEAFAERKQVPVILLSPLSSGKEPRAPAYVLGSPRESVALALAASLAQRGARSVAPVGGSVAEPPPKVAFLDAAPCDAPSSQAGTSHFPVDAWKVAKVDSLLLLGDASCSTEAIVAASTQRVALRAAVGLDGAEIATEPSRLPLLVATAGAFPMKRGDASSALYGFKRRQGKAPSFSAALGHDAATLARVAERALPEGRAEDATEVQKRHRAANEALASAEADLWSTSARGFASRSVIARDVVVVEVR
jgi:hypothetical protein